MIHFKSAYSIMIVSFFTWLHLVFHDSTTAENVQKSYALNDPYLEAT